MSETVRFNVGLFQGSSGTLAKGELGIPSRLNTRIGLAFHLIPSKESSDEGSKVINGGGFDLGSIDLESIAFDGSKGGGFWGSN